MSTKLTTKTITESNNVNGSHSKPYDEWVPRDCIIDIDGPGIEFESGADEKGDFLPLPVEEHERRPSHPGEILADLYLPSTGLTQTELATHLGITRQVLSQVMKGTRRVDIDLAQRLARAFATDADFWLRLQRQCDLWDVAHTDAEPYAHIRPLLRAA